MRQIENKIGETTTDQDKCPNKTCDHMFSMKARSHGLYFHEPILVSYCPQYCSRFMKTTAPQCFFDGKPHFPLFMLGVDRETTVKRQKEYIEAHKNRILNVETSTKEIFIPHPGQAKTTCFVCKKAYTDYRKHIQTKTHKKHLNSSRMEGSIKELIEIVSKEYSSSIKDDMLNICNLEYNRMASSKTQDSDIKPIPKNSRTSLRELKVKYNLEKKVLHDSSEQIEIKEEGDIQIKVDGSVNKVEDYRTTTINFISINQEFRVQDYLI